MALRNFGCVIAFALWAASTPAWAQTEQGACAGEGGVTLDQRIAACDAIIGAERAKGHALAVAYNNRGGAHYYKGEIARALADYDQAITLSPNFAHAFNNRCWAGAVLGRLKQSVADCDKVLKLLNIGNTFENRGFAHLRMGQFDLAFADYDLALKLDGPRADLLFGRGLARIKRGDTGGEADLAAARKLNPKIAEEFERYGLQ
jgi:tetratricopeptide (TPR) repeat protein